MKSEKLSAKNLSLFIIHCSFFLCAFFFVSCAEKPPIPEKKFADLYVHLRLLDAQYAAQPVEQKAKVDSLLRAFSVNDSLVNVELSWYGKDPERWKSFFDEVQSRSKEIKGVYFAPAPFREK